MKIGKLEFQPFDINANVSEDVKDHLLSMSKEDQKLCYVADIDRSFMGGKELCEKFNIDFIKGINCLIVKGKINGEYIYVALLVQVRNKYDINGVLKNKLNSRFSVAPLDEVLSLTKMEYGSITPVGLPSNWLVFADSNIFEQERVICGSGKQTSKLSIPSEFLIKYCNAQPLQNLAIK